MTIKQAIELICKKRACFLVKRFVRNYKKYDSGDKYYCMNHKKCHKYTFHSYIEFAPGTAFFLGVDKASEVIKYAKGLL